MQLQLTLKTCLFYSSPFSQSSGNPCICGTCFPHPAEWQFRYHYSSKTPSPTPLLVSFFTLSYFSGNLISVTSEEIFLIFLFFRLFSYIARVCTYRCSSTLCVKVFSVKTPSNIFMTSIS